MMIWPRSNSDPNSAWEGVDPGVSGGGLRMEPSAWSWGWGEFGRLGHGGTDSKYAPEPLLQDVLVGIVQVACGAHHTVAVREDGGLAVWGWGSEGQLGLGSTRDVLTPTAMYDLSAMGHQVSSVACGYFHCLAVTRNGKVLAWGKGDCGQLGTGDMSGSLVPRVIQSLCAERVKQVACGSAHSLAVTEDGIVYAWGYGSDGQLGLGKGALKADVPRPTKIEGLVEGQAVEVACGSRHSLCVFANGSLFSWGLCDDGRLGLPREFTDAQAHAIEPALVPLQGESVKSCAAGGHHSLICTVTGRVMSCGRGTDFQLGHGDDGNQHMFKVVGGLRHVSVYLVACGDNHSAALTTAQEVYMWGSGEDGQLGHGAEESKSLPTLVQGIGPVSAISLGKLHSVAVRQNEGSSIDRIAELEDKVRDLSALLQSAKSSMQEERRIRLMAERRLHECEQRMNKMERASSLKQRGVEAVTELAALSHKTNSLSCESVGVQTEQIANISSTQMLLDLRRPALSLNGKAQSHREEKELSSNIEAEARRRGDVLRRAAAIHATPAANGAAVRPPSGRAGVEVGASSEGCGTAVVSSGDATDDVSAERKHRHEAFIDAFGGQSEMDRIQSAAMFQANIEDVDSILERELSEEEGSIENASISSSRSLPHPEDHALGDIGGSLQKNSSGSYALPRVSAPPGDKREAARLAALQFVSEEQHAIASRAAKETPKTFVNGAGVAGSKPPTATSSKKLLETGSKVKRGVMGFLRELKDELRAERPTD